MQCYGQGGCHLLPFPLTTALVPTQVMAQLCSKSAQVTDPNKLTLSEFPVGNKLYQTPSTLCQLEPLGMTGLTSSPYAAAPDTGDLWYQQGRRQKNPRTKPSSENKKYVSRSDEMPVLTLYSPQQQKTLFRFFFKLSQNDVMHIV